MATPKVQDKSPRAASAWSTPKAGLAGHGADTQLPLTVDVAIIGGGFSGASMAYHLTQALDARVALLEAGEFCSEASGRNGGQIRPDVYKYTAQVQAQTDSADALRLAEFELENYAAIHETVAALGIECELSAGDTEGWRVFLDRAEFETALAALAKTRALGLDAPDVRVYQAPAVVAATGIKTAVGAIAGPASPISGYRLVDGLLKASIEAGLTLLTHTPVTAIGAPTADDDDFEQVVVGADGVDVERSPASYAFRLDTPRCPVYADRVVHATNGLVESLLDLGRVVVPVRGNVLELAPAEGTTAPPLSRDAAHKITNMNFNDGGEYLVQRPNGNLVLGGGRRFDPGRGVLDVATAAATVAVAAAGGPAPAFAVDADVNLWLRGFFSRVLLNEPARTVPALTAAPAGPWRVVREWTGVMGHSADGMPLVGRVPDRPGQYCVAGFTGHGMPRIFLCAKELAQAIVADASADGLVAKAAGAAHLGASEARMPRVFELSGARLEALRAAAVGHVY
ncbi:FAD dependent oxidoreductase [Dipodascopsis tothii]|uniref:FAD dependent oxidoreductase n=1 Tax=Dipodascopsis tothii TaxID=44089 RepID=UPI0034CDBC97